MSMHTNKKCESDGIHFMYFINQNPFYFKISLKSKSALSSLTSLPTGQIAHHLLAVSRYANLSKQQYTSGYETVGALVTVAVLAVLLLLVLGTGGTSSFGSG